MNRTHDEIRTEIEQTRGELAAKTAELKDRASSAARALRPSHQIHERPLTMVALSVAAGFALERIVFGGRVRKGDTTICVVREADRDALLELLDTRKGRPVLTLAGQKYAPRRRSGFLARLGQLAAAALVRKLVTEWRQRGTRELGSVTPTPLPSPWGYTSPYTTSGR
jgi:hypothetical protein